MPPSEGSEPAVDAHASTRAEEDGISTKDCSRWMFTGRIETGVGWRVTDGDKFQHIGFYLLEREESEWQNLWFAG
jgi:hypothetical protein